MSELANILLKLRLVNREQLEEAVDAQLLNGGRLGTNLVELGHISEKQLADALQTLHRVPTLHGEIVPSDGALQMIRPEWCDKHNLVPLRLEGKRLYIGLLSPYTPEQLRVLGERLGVEVQQVLIPEFRMNQLLRKYAKAFRPVRQIDMTHAATLNATAREQEKPAQELMSEDEFQALYAQALSGGRHTSLEAANAEQAGRESAQHEEQPSSPLHGLSGKLPKLEPAQVPPAAPLPPLSFADAQAALQKTQDREGIAQVVMRFAGGKFARAVLLTLHGDVATGWEGAGASLAGARAKRVALPLTPGSALKLVRESRSHFLGALKDDAPTAAFFKLIGGAPQTALLMPILARERVVNIMYADHGPGRPTNPDLGELMILAQKVGRAYEDFLVRAKQQKLAALRSQ